MLNHEGYATLVVDMEPRGGAATGGGGRRRGAGAGAAGGSGLRAPGRGEQRLCQSLDGGDSCCATTAQFDVLACAWRGSQRLGSTWRCAHHCARRRKAHAAGGLLFRCAECPRAFCEDCLPRESRVINESSRFHALGFVCPKSACYVLCSERCATIAREHAARGI